MRIARHTAYFKLYVCPLADLDTPPRLSVQNMSEFFGKQLKAAVSQFDDDIPLIVLHAARSGPSRHLPENIRIF